MIIIKSDYRDVYKELDRLDSMPDPKMVALLEGVLTTGLETARAKVHVQTGRLKASGTKKSRTNKNDWKGEFSFGNESAGVDYAIYEKERGGGHDFFNQVFLLKALFKQAIAKGLRRR